MELKNVPFIESILEFDKEQIPHTLFISILSLRHIPQVLCNVYISSLVSSGVTLMLKYSKYACQIKPCILQEKGK